MIYIPWLTTGPSLFALRAVGDDWRVCTSLDWTKSNLCPHFVGGLFVKSNTTSSATLLWIFGAACESGRVATLEHSPSIWIQRHHNDIPQPTSFHRLDTCSKKNVRLVYRNLRSPTNLARSPHINGLHNHHRRLRHLHRRLRLRHHRARRPLRPHPASRDPRVRHPILDLHPTSSLWRSPISNSADLRLAGGPIEFATHAAVARLAGFGW